MKTRIIVAAVGIPLLLVVIFFLPVWAMGIVVGAISACAAWEMTKCAAASLPARVRITGAVFAFASPMLSSFDTGIRLVPGLIFLLFLYVFCELMLTFRREERMEYTSAAVEIMACGVMPVMLGALVRLGLNEYKAIYMLMPFIVAFSTDSGAYFAGVYLGKHKLAPHLSPNKTIEGSIGGFAAGVIMMLIYGVILKAVGYEARLGVMCIYGFLGACVCQLGDLAFSAVKRQCDVKDYGDLIPGHGGALDRFDSMHFVAPLIELLVIWVPAVL